MFASRLDFQTSLISFKNIKLCNECDFKFLDAKIQFTFGLFVLGADLFWVCESATLFSN